MHKSCFIVYADIHPGSTIKFTILVNATLYMQAKEHCRQTTGSLGPRVNNSSVCRCTSWKYY